MTLADAKQALRLAEQSHRAALDAFAEADMDCARIVQTAPLSGASQSEFLTAHGRAAALKDLVARLSALVADRRKALAEAERDEKERPAREARAAQDARLAQIAARADNAEKVVADAVKARARATQAAGGFVTGFIRDAYITVRAMDQGLRAWVTDGDPAQGQPRFIVRDPDGLERFLRECASDILTRGLEDALITYQVSRGRTAGVVRPRLGNAGSTPTFNPGLER